MNAAWPRSTACDSEKAARSSQALPDIAASRLIPRMLLDMQNRGQLAAGMTSYNPRRDALLETYKQLGTVAEAFR